MRKFLALVISSVLSCGALAAPVACPDFNKTPGSFCTEEDPHFLQLRYAERIPVCRRVVSTAQKYRILESYGYPREDRANYEIDHLIPLSLGGSNHPDNLWPQPRTPQDNEAKNQLIKKLYDQLVAGTITYEDALHQVYPWCKTGN